MARPDFIGGVTAIAPDGTVIDTNYFTSEAEAREAEKEGMPAEFQELGDRFSKLAPNPEYIDIRNPWLDSA